jgi:hypothetical protein
LPVEQSICTEDRRGQIKEACNEKWAILYGKDEVAKNNREWENGTSEDDRYGFFPAAG